MVVSTVVTPVPVTLTASECVPMELPELSVVLPEPTVTPPFSGCAAIPKEQLTPAARLTEVWIEEETGVVVEVVAHSEMPGKFAGLRKPNGEFKLSAVMVSVEPGVPILVSMSGTIVLVEPTAVAGRIRG